MKSAGISGGVRRIFAKTTADAHNLASVMHRAKIVRTPYTWWHPKGVPHMFISRIFRFTHLAPTENAIYIFSRGELE